MWTFPSDAAVVVRRWFAGRSSLVASATSASVVAVLVATIAIVSGGYEAKRFDLGDGSVWVANGTKQVIGRANTQILALNTVVDSAGTEISVLQNGAHVLLFDSTNSRVDIVNSATASVDESVPLPPEAPELFIAGSNLVIHSTSTGAVWITPLSTLANFDAQSQPAFTFGARSVASVSPDGVLFVYSPATSSVYRVDAAAGASTAQTTGVEFGSVGSAIAITSVGGRWVLLDAAARKLSIEGSTVDLASSLPSRNGAVLQTASAHGDRVLVSYSSGLLGVPLSGGSPRRLATGQSGIAVPPLSLAGCTYAAWSGGVAWRDCSGRNGTDLGSADPVTGPGGVLELTGLSAGASRLHFDTNGSRVVLNDPRSGGTWAVQAKGEAISNWDELITKRDDKQQVEQNNLDTPPVYEKNQVAPVAVDDQFGARASRSSILPVLLNDYDANGDVLVIESVEPIDPQIGRVDVIDARQRLQITLQPGARGIITFGYTIGDGRGASASASVTVTVRAPSENSAPVQVKRTRALVAQGGRVTTPVLGDWVDPDGDAIFLTDAAVPATDAVSFKPEGTVVFQENGGAGQIRDVSLSVSDGTATGVGLLAVTVRPAREVPIIADPFPVQAYAGQSVVIAPLSHVRGGSGTIRLSSVPAKPGASIEVNLDNGTFRFTSDQVRTHYLDYVVNDGEKTAMGVIRVDVASPPEPNSTPITIPKTIFVRTLSEATIDVASSDIDPAGGVLLVTGLTDIPAGSGITADVIDQRSVRVTLTAPLDRGPVTFGYRITNGLAGADGVITVVEIPDPARSQAPVATDDFAAVRVGDAIDIPVLANDVHPDGEQLTLDPKLTSGVQAGGGLLFASGNMLRYLAPDRTGNFSAVYQVRGPDGQVAQAQVHISVREAVVATNSPPAPASVTARVTAGQTVRVPIPLTGIDPDGDSVQLLGQSTNPQKGSVTDVGTDYVDYLAGDYSAGTDSFNYTVIDALGARATGTVRIGIAARTNGARNPVAVADEVETRPGNTVSVQVLANDYDPDGGTLSIVSVTPNTSDVTARVSGGIVRITPPAVPGVYGLVYVIQNEVGGTSSNFIRVAVAANAPPAYPVARDTVLTLSDIVGRDAVTVDVLRNVFFADGDVSELTLSVLPGFTDQASVTSNNRIRVQIQDARQIIPFAVANPTDETVVAYAFVWVPGFNDALPQLDRTAPPLVVASESTLSIPINDYVIAVGGKKVRLVDTTSVQATHANGDPLVVNDQTIQFTSAAAYFGPASISFTVTDGTSATDPGGRTATLVLPIKVLPRENQPPVFVGGVLDFEPGEQKSLDLLRLTTYNDPATIGDLRFSAISTPPTGFEYTITGTTLKITADASAAKGLSTSLTIGVSNAVSTGKQGRLLLRVVPSTRPLARPAPDSVIVPRGQTTTVDVLANDEATNPFPGRPLRVTSIRGLDGGQVPPGVSITPSANNATLQVSVSATAEPVDTNLQYQVTDITGDAARITYGQVRISVQDRPDAPVAPARAEGGFEDGLLTLRLTAPLANNSPITGYTVISSSRGDYRHDCGLVLRCALTDLQAGEQYQFQVIATNAIGASDPSPSSVVLSADYLPVAPATVTAVPLDTNPEGAAIRVSWSTVPNPNPGSPIVGYTLRITGGGVDFSRNVNAGVTTTDTTASGALVANTQYTATIYARNSANVLSDADWRRTTSAPVTTIGPPSSTAGGVAAVVVNTAGHIQVTWGASDPNGGTTIAYSVGRFTTGQSIPTSCTKGQVYPGVTAGAEAPVSSGWTDTNTVDTQTYRYVVYAENEFFCTPTASGAVETKSAPGVASSTTSAEAHGGQEDLKVSGLRVASGNASRFEVQVGGSGTWQPVADGDWLTSAANRSVYGNPQSVQYRGCRDSTSAFCGPASAPVSVTPINARANLVSCTIGQTPTSNPPQNSNLRSVRYFYSFDDGGGGSWGPFVEDGSAPPPSPLPGSETRARVQALVELTGGQTYRDASFDELGSACTP